MRRKPTAATMITSSLLVITIFGWCCVQLLNPRVEATEIKWTSNNHDKVSSAAANAPKSQRYWDKHGIERPDYAKTDAEIAAERGEGPLNNRISFLIGLCVLLGILAYYYYMRYHDNIRSMSSGGSRLGSNGNYQNISSFFPFGKTNATTEDEIHERVRKARLAHFACNNNFEKQD